MMPAPCLRQMTSGRYSPLMRSNATHIREPARIIRQRLSTSLTQDQSYARRRGALAFVAGSAAGSGYHAEARPETGASAVAGPAGRAELADGEEAAALIRRGGGAGTCPWSGLPGRAETPGSGWNFLLS